MNEQIVVQSHNGILLSNIKEPPTDVCTDTDEFRNIMLSERNHTQKVTEINSIYTILLKRQNYDDRKMCGFQDSGRGWEGTGSKGSRGDFLRLWSYSLSLL